MKAAPQWEVLVGDTRVLDYFEEPVRDLPHPLQELIEEFVDTQLTDDERELFLMRYGEQLPIRTIARRLGYNSHQVIQVYLKRIEEKAERWISEHS